MDDTAAEKEIRDYAAACGVPVLRVRLLKKHRAWWYFKVSWREFELDSGAGRVRVVFASYGIQSFEYYPTDPDGFMLPPWAAFPGFTGVTIFWRMAPGEAYWDRWHAWYHSLSTARRAAYRARFPAPTDEEQAWEGFYDRTGAFAPAA
jgi:hypothetical protein